MTAKAALIQTALTLELNIEDTEDDLVADRTALVASRRADNSDLEHRIATDIRMDENALAEMEAKLASTRALISAIS